MINYMTSFFNSKHKNSKDKQAVEKHVILGFSGLVGRNNRQKTIEQIAQLLDLSRNNLDKYCAPLFRSLLEWAQNLPATESSYYSKDATLIDHLLQRTFIALRNCNTYFTLHKDNLGLFGKDKNAWLYMLFSVGMLQGVGSIVTDMEINIYNEKGENPKVWTPFSGSMLSQGTYFSYHFNETIDLRYKNRATLFLAQQLMPQKGLEWLISNPNIFATWLALLDEDEEGGGAIKEILQLLLQLLMLANAESIGKNLDKVFKHLGHIWKEIPSHNHLFEPNIPTIGEVPLAYQITDYLRQNLDDGTLKIGLNSLQIVQGGLLLLPETARLFFEKYPYNIQASWEDVQADFVEKKLCVTDREGNALRTFTDSKGNTYTGLVIEQSKLFFLPENVNIVSPDTAETISITRSQFFSIPAYILTDLIEQNGNLSNMLDNTQNLNFIK